MSGTTLHERLRTMKRRLLAVGFSASMGWGLALAALLLMLSMWLDLVLDLAPVPRVICGIASAAIGLAMLARLSLSAWRQSAPAAVARRLDQAAGARGQILSGVDLLLQPASRGEDGATVARGQGGDALTAGLAKLAMDRAATLAAKVATGAAAPARPLYRPAGGLLCLGAAAMFVGLGLPRLAATQWERFFDPFGDHPPYSRIQFTVAPGDTKVIYGGTLDIRAATNGEPIENAEVVFKTNESAGEEEALPMFPEGGGKWRATLTNITLPGRYFVRTRGARTRKFEMGVTTVPKLEKVRFRITPPAYTHRPPLAGPLPPGGLAALPGTLVQVWAKSNRPLGGGSIQAEGPQGIAAMVSPATAPATASSFALAPVAPGSNEVAGSFVVRASGKVSVKVSDVEGQSSTDAFTVPVTLLRDERPFVRILEPKPDSYATPDITLNIEILAEDDYGVSRVELFRGLDDSRVRSMPLPVPAAQPTRLPLSVPLPLADYALSPGDVVKLYARVEDNDPDGPKGSESPIVTVKIVSKEEMQRMMLAREGLEVLLSKYEQAARSMEAAGEQLDKLRKELEKLDPNSELAKEMREQLKNAADQIGKDAEQLSRMSAEDLPFDIDHALKKQLDESAQAMEKASDAASKLARGSGISAAAAAKKLAEAQKELGGEREKFKDEAADPLDHLAKVYPLIEDEARFAELWQRQRDLADRMDALTGHDGDDDPKLKSRMRDLEAEQHQLRDELRQLVDDIENRAAELPSDKRLDDLRDTAKKFVKGVRASSAADEMASAESGLAEFAGSRAHTQARAAADTLEKFIAECQGMGDQAGNCLKFQPKLAAGLGNTVQELLDAEGLGSKPGNGQGSGGGYSARRNSLRNVGMYGRIPMRGRESRAAGGRAQRGASGDNRDGANAPGNADGAGSDGRLHASGQSDAAVPARYKRRVGEYFQRVADELGEEQPK